MIRIKPQPEMTSTVNDSSVRLSATDYIFHLVSSELNTNTILNC